MDTKTLSAALSRAADLLKASGAKSQAASVEAVAEVVAGARQDSVENFVDFTKAKLSGPQLDELSPQEFVDRLDAARNERTTTLDLLASLKSTACNKTKVLEIAKLVLTGRRKLDFKTKPQAIKAIEERIHERMYLDSKDAMNQKVAPW